MFRFFDATYQAMNIILEENDHALWLGDCSAAFDKALLDSKGIKTVLTVAAGLNVHYPEGTITHKVYNIFDIESANIAKFFPDTYNQITEGLQRGSVLVHCAAGVSRSASVVIAYVMKSKNLSFQDSINFVRKRRGIIFPNYGFQRQLRNYEKQLKDTKKHIEQLEKSQQCSNNQESKLLTQSQLQKQSQLQQYQQQQYHQQQQQQRNLIQNHFEKGEQFLTSKKNSNDVSHKPALKPLSSQKKDDNLQMYANRNHLKTQNNHKQINNQSQKKQLLQQGPQSTRSQSSQPKFLLTSNYNSTYLGPQIITHQKNKLFESKLSKIPTSIPDINLKSQHNAYKKI